MWCMVVITWYMWRQTQCWFPGLGHLGTLPLEGVVDTSHALCVNQKSLIFMKVLIILLGTHHKFTFLTFFLSQSELSTLTWCTNSTANQKPVSTINVKGNLDFKLTRQTGVNLDGGWILKPRFQLNFILHYTAIYIPNQLKSLALNHTPPTQP